MKYLRINNVSIHINLYQNQETNVLERKKPKPQSHGVFLVRYRGTYVLNKTKIYYYRCSSSYFLTLQKIASFKTNYVSWIRCIRPEVRDGYWLRHGMDSKLKLEDQLKNFRII